MASQLPLSFLRPMSLPRPSTMQKYLSLARPLSQSTRNSSNSTTTTTTTTTTPLSSSPPTPIASTPSPPTTSTTAPLKPYRVLRTPSNKLPVYLLWKRGGNKELTRVRKIEGDINQLKADLQVALGMKDGEVTVNQLARQVVVKGHKKPQIEQFFKGLQQ